MPAKRNTASPPPVGNRVGSKAILAVLALSTGLMTGPAKVLEQADSHLDCMAIYALLRMAAPSFVELADERGHVARQAYFRDLPFPLPGPMPMTDGEIEAETGARVQARGARIAETETDADVTRETDAFLADIHACDARYGLAPTPTPWRD